MSTKANITLLPYRERVKLVRERMYALRFPPIAELPKSVRVLAAEKLLKEWQQKNYAYEDAQRQAHQRKRAEVSDALIMGDTEKAITLLRALEV